MTVAIWWIRRDLRLADNQALHRAMALADEILPVFILDRRLLNSDYACARRTDFLMDGLSALDANLRSRGSRLFLFKGEPSKVLSRLCTDQQIAVVIAEKDVSPFARRRDSQVADSLDGVVDVEYTDGLTIRPIGSNRKANGQPYTVFTPYSRRWKSDGPLTPADLLPAPLPIKTAQIADALPLPDRPSRGAGRSWQAGEAAALSALQQFCGGDMAPIYAYANHRDRPDLNATSWLSPYLRFGMVSPRRVAVAAYAALHNASSEPDRVGAETWLNELIWRDFYINILAEYPHVRAGSFRRAYDSIRWENDGDAFDAWCQGRTGYPFVDAAMRQLLATGWMHNRARMVAASFLVKDLLIDWRWGERWFMQQLLDGDPASNNGGWQWTAGTGTDAAPYFRIFNPVAQGKKFDADGTYVRRWVPELAGVATAAIHEPWKMSAADQAAAQCTVGVDYPRPIVDHRWARQRTLDAYKTARGSD